MTGSIASLVGFSYWYPNSRLPALDGVDLELDGGLTLIAGGSGSGKSSLLRVCNGLVPHFHGGTVMGSAEVCGHDVISTATRVLATRVGFVFQDPELQSVYASVDRDVAFGLENIGVATPAMRERVADALEQTGIAHLRGRAVATLSGGERQRLALAGVLAMRPRLLA
ncbi:MAG TPA: ABC transporter ATP-binding protein, partial [Candidatus Dormibacteraeota bacterium]